MFNLVILECWKARFTPWLSEWRRNWGYLLNTSFFKSSQHHSHYYHLTRTHMDVVITQANTYLLGTRKPHIAHNPYSRYIMRTHISIQRQQKAPFTFDPLSTYKIWIEKNGGNAPLPTCPRSLTHLPDMHRHIKSFTMPRLGRTQSTASSALRLPVANAARFPVSGSGGMEDTRVELSRHGKSRHFWAWKKIRPLVQTKVYM